MQAQLLIVEDNPNDAVVLQHNAESADTDFIVTVATNWQEFQDAKRKTNFDMAVIDVELGGEFDGFDVARELPGKALLATGHPPEALQRKAAMVGALGCIPKADLKASPALFDEFAARVMRGGRLHASTVEQARVATLESQLLEVNAKLAARRGGVVGVLDWIGEHPWIFLGTLGGIGVIVALIVIGVLAAGAWPG